MCMILLMQSSPECLGFEPGRCMGACPALREMTQVSRSLTLDHYSA